MERGHTEILKHPTTLKIQKKEFIPRWRLELLSYFILFRLFSLTEKSDKYHPAKSHDCLIRGLGWRKSLFVKRLTIDRTSLQQ